MNNFGSMLRQLRKENLLTQKKLCEQLRERGHEIYGASTISRWEVGSRMPKMNIIEDMEDILGADRGVLLKVAGYLVEISPDQPVTSQIDLDIAIQKGKHSEDLASIAKSLLSNGLGNVSLPGWTTNRTPQVKYLLPNDNAASGYDELTEEQLSEQLNQNMAAVIKERDWFFRRCFVPHLKSELPEELKTEPLFIVVEKQPYQLINTLRVLAAKKAFKGTCPSCP